MMGYDADMITGTADADLEATAAADWGDVVNGWMEEATAGGMSEAAFWNKAYEQAMRGEVWQ